MVIKNIKRFFNNTLENAKLGFMELNTKIILQDMDRLELLQNMVYIDEWYSDFYRFNLDMLSLLKNKYQYKIFDDENIDDSIQTLNNFNLKFGKLMFKKKKLSKNPVKHIKMAKKYNVTKTLIEYSEKLITEIKKHNDYKDYLDIDIIENRLKETNSFIKASNSALKDSVKIEEVV